MSFIFFTDHQLERNMSRFLVAEDNPRVLADHPTIEEIDIDHMAINLPVNDEETEDVLKSLVGNAVQLATGKGRLWHREHWNFLILAWNPIIILTTFSNVTKDHLCNYFNNNGHVVLPSGEGASHIIRCSNKSVPTTTFMTALIDADVDFVRLINFGMKQKLHTFPHLPRELLSCNATDHGYPLYFKAHRIPVPYQTSITIPSWNYSKSLSHPYPT
jgi:hypothetical protein